MMKSLFNAMITNAQGFRPGSERSQSDGFDRPIGREKTGDCTRCAIERTRRLLITFYGKKVIKRPITGADFGIGESRIAYRPYGEIDRVNSDGPDITRFKYTGQVEDSESRLMYYKARYYDPQIGTFISADSVVQPESPSGMNRFAYVSGNPVNSRDPSGNRLSLPLQGAVIGYFVAPAFGLTREQGAIAGFFMASGGAKAIGNNIGNTAKVAGTNIGNAATWISKGWDNAARTFNNATGKSKYGNGQSDWDRSDLGNFYKAVGQFYIDYTNAYINGMRRNVTTDCVMLAASVFSLITGEGIVFDLLKWAIGSSVGARYVMAYYLMGSASSAKSCVNHL